MARPRSSSSAAARLLLLLVAVAAALQATDTALPVASGFIRKSCRAMQYPSVREHSLAAYRGSPPSWSLRELARAALAVSVDRARASFAYVGRLCGSRSGSGDGSPRRGAKKGSAAAGPMRNCLENLADSVGHLPDAAQEIGGAGMRSAGTESKNSQDSGYTEMYCMLNLK
ncbi:pectinesterase inhibitor 9-like [Zea mays]|uniref:pectinesterase inhibitor 9-like n=1 Tax=Zea mays TaxID=4577 RepID=UPI0004DEBC79|nr:pectinesterase inhibitor 9-like [Zea mays]|eukprot:XP_008664257.1 pectinesterase inhibitor 9-like [Zea mays]